MSMHIETPSSFNAAQRRAAEAFISQVVAKARMASKPDVELNVDFDEDRKVLSVSANSELHSAFGVIALGPRGGAVYSDIHSSFNL